MQAKVRAKLDFVNSKLDNDGEDAEAEKVKGSLDRLAFASQVSNVQSAFGSLGHDALDEVGSLAHKAQETVALFQASQYASKWMPIDTKLSMKPTYVKVPVQTVERIKFYENEQLNMIVAQHAEEKETILAENAGLRSMMGLEGSSEAVEEIRETEDGVNRALLMSAVEEIKRLRTRVTVLEGEAARHRVQSSGYWFSSGGDGGVDSQQMAKLTKELARLEEDNGRQKWMIGEKDKQIKEVQGKYQASEAYKLQEKLQECMEALQVAANLQAEQLQYLEDNALKKLESMDDQIADVQDDLDTKSEHLAQLKTIMKSYWEKGDEALVPIMVSLAGFNHAEAETLKKLREKRANSGVSGMAMGLGRFGLKIGGAAVQNLLVACAPPPVAIPNQGDALPTSKPAGGDADAKHGEEAKETVPASGESSVAPTPVKAAKEGDAAIGTDDGASMAPPTAEKMPPSASSSVAGSEAGGSAAPSAAATPAATPAKSEAAPRVSGSEVGGASTAPTPLKDDLSLPSPPVALGNGAAGEESNDSVAGSAPPSPAPSNASTASTATVAAGASVPSTPSTATKERRAARRREGETEEQREARERERKERREKLASSKGTSSKAHGKKKEAVFSGFEDEAAAEKEAKKRAEARPALPAPKLLGKAAEREAAKKKEEAARRAEGGFAGFGGDDDSDSD